MTNNEATEAAAGKADIVERLERALAKAGPEWSYYPLVKEAATEIASLRERVKELERIGAEALARMMDDQTKIGAYKAYATGAESRAKDMQTRAETAERSVTGLEASSLATENAKLKSWIDLHRGDTMSLSNEVDHFREELALAERERDQAREALGIAMGHIEHMAAWITGRNNDPTKPSAYSFESLGEDMPQIRAARAIMED